MYFILQIIPLCVLNDFYIGMYAIKNNQGI